MFVVLLEYFAHFAGLLVLAGLPALVHLLDLPVELVLLELVPGVLVAGLALVLLALDVLLDVLELLGPFCHAQVLLPPVAPALDQVLQQCAQPGEGLLHVALVDETQQLEILVSAELVHLLQHPFLRRIPHLQDRQHVISHCLVAVNSLLFLLLVDCVVRFADVFDELNDSLVVVIVDAVLYVLVVDEGVEVLEERLEKLGDAVLDDPLAEHLADDEFGQKLDVGQDALLELLQEQLLVFARLELRELLDPLVERVLHRVHQEQLERVSILLRELEVRVVLFAEAIAEFSIGAGVFRLVPGLLYGLLH